MMEMQNVPTAVLLGGDHRMAHAAAELQNAGYAVTFWGRDSCASPPTAETALSDADLVVLPIPATRDGVHLNAPDAPQSISLEEIVAALRPDQTVVGGTLPEKIADAVLTKGCRIYDCQTDERFILPNALATAEGAIAMAIAESDGLLAESDCVVLGFGRVAKQLCRLLLAMGARVTVIARRESDRILARTLGYAALPFYEADTALARATLLFNTVPARLTDFARASGTIIDLAPVYEPSQMPVKVIRAAALPAKYAPAYAGRLMARCILAHLSEVKQL
ncbi:MAG: hypothetical protein IJW62_04500 [Clostridia bacterium]|nr:hypothetical protein [Clostridia bacterium]